MVHFNPIISESKGTAAELRGLGPYNSSTGPQDHLPEAQDILELLIPLMSVAAAGTGPPFARSAPFVGRQDDDVNVGDLRGGGGGGGGCDFVLPSPARC